MFPPTGITHCIGAFRGRLQIPRPVLGLRGRQGIHVMTRSRSVWQTVLTPFAEIPRNLGLAAALAIWGIVIGAWSIVTYGGIVTDTFLPTPDAVIIKVIIPTIVAMMPDDVPEALATALCNTSAACEPMRPLSCPMIALWAASRPNTSPAIATTISSTGASDVTV